MFFTVRGRRNWLQIAGEAGLKSAAVLRGLAATTKRQVLNPWEYLKHLLTASAARPLDADCSDLQSDAWEQAHPGCPPTESRSSAAHRSNIGQLTEASTWLAAKADGGTFLDRTLANEVGS
jgi:hypothetical protein